MPDQPTQRDRIRAVIRDFYGAAEGQFLPLAADLADRIDKALSTTGGGAALVGPFLTPHELTEIRQRNDGASGAVTRLLRHVEALTATIRNQNATMDDQQRRVRELGRLQSEMVRLLEIGEADPDDIWADSIPEHLWRREPMVHATEEEYPAIFAVLRAAQAEREGRRG